MILKLDKGTVLMADHKSSLGLTITKYGGVLVSQDVFDVLRALNTKRDGNFAQSIERVSDDDLMQLFNEDIITSDWNEAILLCEREIARRGLHVKDNTERFDL